MSRAGARKPTGTIGIIAQDTARYSQFAICLAQLRTDWEIKHVFGYDAAYARHRLAETFEGDYLLFLDDDHAFQPDLVERLLKHRKDIVAPLYLKRGQGFRPTAYETDYNTRLRLGEPGLVEVGITGTSGMLIHRRVFDSLGSPFFRAGHVPGMPHAIGEDADFCIRAREHGFQVWCDTSLPFGHIGAATVMPVHTPGGWKLAVVIGDALVTVPYEQEEGT